jgi:DNA-binding GntR family transcriptional regulator
MSEASRMRTSGAHFVYLELKRRILDLELKPGERLYEPGLAADLEVSRTPLREAVRKLMAENLLEQQPTGGVVVPQLDARDISELYDVRAALEGLMAAEASKRATPTQLEELQGLVDRNAALVTFADDAMHAGASFHAKIGQIADNTWAARLHEQVTNQMRRYKMYTNHTQARRDQALAEHHTICAAIASGDPRKSGDLAFEHVVGARDVALRAISSHLTT